MFILLLKLVTTYFSGIIFFMGELFKMNTEVFRLTQEMVNFLFPVKKRQRFILVYGFLLYF